MATGRLVEVYLDLLSQPCRAVQILLSCNRPPHRVRTVALRKGEERTPEFTKLNPMQKVPVMVDNGFVLTESDAILKYLVTKYNLPEHWYPRQPERRARVDEYTA
ncbi:glutathione S-transferase theta-1-like [Centroberyx gerrardi]